MENVDDYNKDVAGAENETKESYGLGDLVDCRSDSVSESQHLAGLLSDSEKSAAVDVNERYVRDEVIGEAESTGGADLFALLSAELNNDQYLIRTPEQQAEWTENPVDRALELREIRSDSFVEDKDWICFPSTSRCISIRDQVYYFCEYQ